ncbi:unnamed protein product [Sphagnum balticum]
MPNLLPPASSKQGKQQELEVRWQRRMTDRGALRDRETGRGEETTGVSTNPQTLLPPAHGELAASFLGP